MIGSIVLADFPSRSELDTWLRTDPYVTQGVWQEIEVQLPPRSGPGSPMKKCDKTRPSTLTRATEPRTFTPP